MDTARFGHTSPLSAVLVQDAATGYLASARRTTSIDRWRDAALAWATEQLKGAVRALEPMRPAEGTGVVGYQVADYLDQYGRRARQDQLGRASLWDALAAYATSDSDLIRLPAAARDRGLYRHAAALWTSAANLGSTYAGGQLIAHLREVSPAYTARAARWVVVTIDLGDSWAVSPSCSVRCVRWGLGTRSICCWPVTPQAT
jgi:hypothetical protein